MSEKAPINVPLSQSGQPVQIVPSQTSLASTTNSAISASTTITLKTDTTFLEVNTRNQAVYMKWGSSVTTANNGFDEYILPDQTRHFGVPSGITQVSFIEAAATATIIVIEKNKGY